ncbi:MAG: hypothetical protein QW303_01225 [Nitrososphaerota archaeon]
MDIFLLIQEIAKNERLINNYEKLREKYYEPFDRQVERIKKLSSDLESEPYKIYHLSRVILSRCQSPKELYLLTALVKNSSLENNLESHQKLALFLPVALRYIKTCRAINVDKDPKDQVLKKIADVLYSSFNYKTANNDTFGIKFKDFLSDSGELINRSTSAVVNPLRDRVFGSFFSPFKNLNTTTLLLTLIGIPISIYGVRKIFTSNSISDLLVGAILSTVGLIPLAYALSGKNVFEKSKDRNNDLVTKSVSYLYDSFNKLFSTNAQRVDENE